MTKVHMEAAKEKQIAAGALPSFGPDGGIPATKSDMTLLARDLSLSTEKSAVRLRARLVDTKSVGIRNAGNAGSSNDPPQDIASTPLAHLLPANFDSECGSCSTVLDLRKPSANYAAVAE